MELPCPSAILFGGRLSRMHRTEGALILMLLLTNVYQMQLPRPLLSLTLLRKTEVAFLKAHWSGWRKEKEEKKGEVRQQREKERAKQDEPLLKKKKKKIAPEEKKKFAPEGARAWGLVLSQLLCVSYVISIFSVGSFVGKRVLPCRRILFSSVVSGGCF
jgi:hypothetical protein